MTRSFRPSTPADAAAILALFDTAGFHPNSEPSHLQWKYWQPRADWTGSRSFVLADETGLIAHTAILPGACMFGSQRIRTIQMIDWVARPGEFGAGVILLKRLAQQTEALVSIAGGELTLKILPHLGFRPLGVATGYSRALFPFRLLRSHAIPLWRRWPRFARSVAWALTAPAARCGNWTVRRIAGDDIDRIASVLPLPVRGMSAFERSAELFRFTLSCPIVPMALYSMERSERTHGYFVLASAAGQVRIVDCRMVSADPADWREMILCAVGRASQDPQAVEVVTWANDPLLARALKECGFHARFTVPIQIRPANQASMPNSLRVQMLDSDGAYLDMGPQHLWA
jgi:hypothetical protein